MAKVDINAIRKRLEQINAGGGRSGGGSKWKRWKYEGPGTFTIRVLPFADADPGMPFPERIVYYGIQGDGKGMIVSPENNGGEDPIKNFRIDLYNQAKNAETPAQADELKKMAKLLSSKTANSVAVVDRSKEGDGVHMWSPNYTDVQQLIALFMTDAGDYTDLTEGCDLELVVSAGKKMNQNTGKPLLEAKISAKRTNSPAHKDPAIVKTWLETMPVIDDYYPVTSTEDTAKKLQEWLDAGDHKTGSDGLARGGAPKAAAEKPAVEEKVVEAEKPVERKTPPVKPAAKKTLLADVADDMDSALDDLET